MNLGVIMYKLLRYFSSMLNKYVCMNLFDLENQFEIDQFDLDESFCFIINPRQEYLLGQKKIGKLYVSTILLKRLDEGVMSNDEAMGYFLNQLANFLLDLSVQQYNISYVSKLRFDDYSDTAWQSTTLRILNQASQEIQDGKRSKFVAQFFVALSAYLLEGIMLDEVTLQAIKNNASSNMPFIEKGKSTKTLESNKYLIFGNIHARTDLAEKLVDKSKKENLHLISIGDVFHGKESLGIETFDLLDSNGCQFIMGNHEYIFIKYLDELRKGKSREDALRSADFSCKYLRADDPKFLRILRETEDEIRQLGEHRLSKIARFPFSMIFGSTEVYHAKPGVGSDALDDATQFWLDVIDGRLHLNNRTIIVGHEGDYAIQYDKMIFDQQSGKVIALDLKAKRGGHLGWCIIDKKGKVIKTDKIF